MKRIQLLPILLFVLAICLPAGSASQGETHKRTTTHGTTTRTKTTPTAKTADTTPAATGYEPLDSAIVKLDEYYSKKETRIANAKSQVDRCSDERSKYDLLLNLYTEYSTYNSQKAYDALDECIKIAQKLGKQDLERRIDIQISYQKALDGKFQEALTILDSIDTQKLSQRTLETYQFARFYSLTRLASAEKSTQKAAQLRTDAGKLAEHYLATADKNSRYYNQLQVMHMLNGNRITAAIGVCDTWKTKVVAGTTAFATMARYTAVCNKKDPTIQLPWLITAAKAEIESAMTNGDALQALIAILKNNGDTERATRYEEVVNSLRNKYSFKEEKSATAEESKDQSAPVKDIEESSNEGYNHTSQNTSKYWVPTTIAVVFAVLFALTLFLLIIKDKKTRFAEDKLIETSNILAAMRMQLIQSGKDVAMPHLPKATPQKNSIFSSKQRPQEAPAAPSEEVMNLMSKNTTLQKQNEALSAKVTELVIKTRELNEKIKNLSEGLPVDVSPTATANNTPADPVIIEKEVIKEVEVVKEVVKEVPVVKEVIKEVPVIKEVVKEVIKEVPVVKEGTTATNETPAVDNKAKDQMVPLMVSHCAKHLTDEQMEEVYNRFDTIILKTFPHFPQEFNALLQPESRQIMRKRGELTTEMRMAALIRLGITNSAQIADFLHLSANTVYNYRARLKSKALGDREQFEEMIKRIGES